MQSFRLAEKALGYLFELIGIGFGKTSRDLKDHGHVGLDTQKKI